MKSSIFPFLHTLSSICCLIDFLKSIKTAIQLHSFHMLVRLCSKSFKLGFCSMSAVNFQMCKVGFEEEEEPKIKLATLAQSPRKQRSTRKTSSSASLTTLKPLTMWVKTNWKILQEMGVPDHLTCLLETCLWVKKQVRTGYKTMDWFKTGKEVQQGCILSSCLFNLHTLYIMGNAGLNES